MALSPSEAEEAASELFNLRSKDRRRLEKIRDYLTGEPRLVWLPMGAPRELQALAQMARVNVMNLVVKSTTQQMFVDGYTSEDEVGSEVIWGIWQRNRWDRKQIGVHRSAGSYGSAYATILPGDNGVPLLRPVSPQRMTTAFGSDMDWPRFGLEERSGGPWRLYDDENTYDLLRSSTGRRTGGTSRGTSFQFVPGSDTSHEQDVTPIVRYVSDEDLDDPVIGDVEPLFTLQDQINLTTFHLLVAQHYGAHGRKIIIGRMVKELEAKLVKASANTMMTVNAEPGDVQFEELSQTQLDGFLESRQAALRMMSAISQTPANELLGTLANLAAAALVENRESTARKVAERQIIYGESHEQLLGQAGNLIGIDLDPMARVRWKPTLDQRAIQLVSMLGDIADKLGVNPRALWDHLPFSGADIVKLHEAASTTDQRVESDQSESETEEDDDASDSISFD